MGRIRTKLVKRVTREVIEKHGSELKTDYIENKRILADLLEIPSKKLRNVVAGSVTRTLKNK